MVAYRTTEHHLKSLHEAITQAKRSLLLAELSDRKEDSILFSDVAIDVLFDVGFLDLLHEHCYCIIVSNCRSNLIAILPELLPK